MTIGVVCKEDNPEALALSAEVIRRLGDNGTGCLFEDHIALSLGLEKSPDVWSNSDVLVVVGGDGTILRAVRMSAPREVPLLGVHMGYLGFLTEVTSDEVFGALDDRKAGRYTLDRRTMLEVSLERAGSGLATPHVVNDMVINKGALARIVHMEVWTDDVFITSYWGEGS
jgi:NAD+ kinase